MDDVITYETPRRLVLENDTLRVLIDPEAGGKIRSFFSKPSRTEWFYTDTRTRHVGTGYSDHDISGFDECFPTVLPCTYPEGRRKGMTMEDHGLLWQQPWQVNVEREQVRMICEAPSIQCRFERTCRLEAPASLRLDYRINHDGREPLGFVYSAHPLLRASAQTQWIFPEELKTVFVYLTGNVPKLTDQTWIDWPPPEEMGLIGPLSTHRGSFAKLFSQKLTTGQAAIRHDETGETLRFEFDTRTLPYMGIFAMQGYDKQPDGYFKSQLLIAIEPTTSIGDDLQTALATGTLKRISAGEQIDFWIRLRLV